MHKITLVILLLKPLSLFLHTSSDTQRQATKDAGKIAGLDVKRIITELHQLHH